MEKTYKAPNIIKIEDEKDIPMSVKDLPICKHEYNKNSDNEEVYDIKFEDGKEGTVYAEAFSYNLYYFKDEKDFRHTYKKIKRAVFALYVYLKYNSIIPEDEF